MRKERKTCPKCDSEMIFRLGQYECPECLMVIDAGAEDAAEPRFRTSTSRLENMLRGIPDRTDVADHWPQR